MKLIRKVICECQISNNRKYGLNMEERIPRERLNRVRASGWVAGCCYGMARPSPAPETYCLRTTDSEGIAMQIAVLGVDLGKNSCSIVGLDTAEPLCCGDACAVRELSNLRKN